MRPAARDDRQLRAARNNALWCDAVCRARGHPGEFVDDLWLSRWEAPPLHPNVVTLSPARGEDAPLRRVRELLASALPGGWAVKDSFCELALAPLGFRTLLEGRWLWRPAASPLPAPRGGGAIWTRIEDAPGLARFEAAWSASGAGDAAAPAGGVFAAPLLEDPDVAILAARGRGGDLLAGAIASRSDDLIGLSNFFAQPGDGNALAAGALAAAQGAFGPRAIVCWEPLEAQARAHRLGFEVLGPLRVWVREPAGSAAEQPIR